VLAAGLFWFWLGLLAAGQWRAEWRKPLRPVMLGSLVLLLGAASCLGTVANERWRKITAIIVVRDAQARMAPYDEAKSGVPLPDGSELTVTGTKDDWLEIRDQNQRTGWVKKSQVVY
jgi:hypothetical protein